SADGKILVSGGWDTTVRVWEVSTGKELRAFNDREEEVYKIQPVPMVLLTPDGKTLIAGDNQRIQFWDLATGKAVRTIHDYSHFSFTMALSPDGKVLATAGDHHVIRLWHTASGKPLIEPQRPLNGLDWVTFAPDGRTVVTGALDGNIRLWDPRTGKQQGEIAHQGPSVISPD